MIFESTVFTFVNYREAINASREWHQRRRLREPEALEALQEYQEIKRHLLQIEESYVRNDIIEEKTVSALETLDCLYNKKVELLINGD